MMAALLWSGIEAIFDINTELRFRLATAIAVVLEPRSGRRTNLYLRVKELYDTRSRIVHGGKVTSDQITEHVVEVRGLLSRLLCRFMEDENVPSQDDLEKLLFE